MRRLPPPPLFVPRARLCGPARMTSALLLAGGLAGCSMFDPPPDAPLPGDRFSPARVADLHVDSAVRTNDRSMRV